MSKKILYRIPVCIFIFVVGSITALLFASVLNDVLTTGSISTDLTDFSTIFSGVFGGEKPRKLYLLLEALVVLLCVVYFVCAERTYQTETYKVTDNISVPVPSGQGQHGTAWFMSDKIKRRAFETLGYKVHVIDFNTPKKSDRYNPLQSIINAVNENRIDDAQNCVWEFVTFLVEKNDHSEPIWTNGECSVIAAAVMCVVYDNQNHPEFQNLTNVYNFIANMCKTVNKVLPIDASKLRLMRLCRRALLRSG